MLPAGLNGVAYPSQDDIAARCAPGPAVAEVRQVEDYKYDSSTCARAQLAMHPAMAQFLLDNAANAERRPAQAVRSWAPRGRGDQRGGQAHEAGPGLARPERLHHGA